MSNNCFHHKSSYFTCHWYVNVMFDMSTYALLASWVPHILLELGNFKHFSVSVTVRDDCILGIL